MINFRQVIESAYWKKAPNMTHLPDLIIGKTVGNFPVRKPWIGAFEMKIGWNRRKKGITVKVTLQAGGKNLMAGWVIKRLSEQLGAPNDKNLFNFRLLAGIFQRFVKVGVFNHPGRCDKVTLAAQYNIATARQGTEFFRQGFPGFAPHDDRIDLAGTVDRGGHLFKMF